MAGFLTTHVLDTANGRPASGLEIELFRLEGDERSALKTVSTNDDGRVVGPSRMIKSRNGYSSHHLLPLRQ